MKVLFFFVVICFIQLHFSQGAALTSGSSSKRVKRALIGDVFGRFNDQQLQEFKEAFKVIDQNNDGVIGVGELGDTFDTVSKLTYDLELKQILGVVFGPIGFIDLLTELANN